MENAPPENGLPPNLRFLKLLVTVLTATMIGGLVIVIFLLVTRLPGGSGAILALPDRITLPSGAKPLAFTVGPGWIAVVTDASDILIFDATTGAQRQVLHVGE